MPIEVSERLRFLRARSVTLRGCRIERVAIAGLIMEETFWGLINKHCEGT